MLVASFANIFFHWFHFLTLLWRWIGGANLFLPLLMISNLTRFSCPSQPLHPVVYIFQVLPALPGKSSEWAGRICSFSDKHVRTSVAYLGSPRQLVTAVSYASQAHCSYLWRIFPTYSSYIPSNWYSARQVGQVVSTQWMFVNWMN